MSDPQDRHARKHHPKRTGTLGDRLELMFEWYKGMVDDATGRLLYSYDPETGRAVSDGEPIRDVAAVWDVEVLSACLGRNDLRDLIRRSLATSTLSRATATRSWCLEESPRPSPTAAAPSSLAARAHLESRPRHAGNWRRRDL